MSGGLDPRALRRRTGTDPAANVEATYVCDEDEIVVAVGVTLVTDANAANRRVSLVVDDGTNELFRFTAAADQVASTTARYQGVPGAGVRDAQGATPNIVQTVPIPLPGILLRSGWRIVTSTVSRQAGDNFGPIAVLAERQ